MRHGLSATAFALSLLAAPILAAAGPTFDCSKASGEIEKLICSDAALAALDRRMKETFDAAVAALEKSADREPATKRLRAVQRGWIKGRNDCWKGDDERQCTEDAYETRIAELEARYMLLEGSKPVFFECEGNPANEIVATFYRGARPSVRLERGDQVAVGVQVRSASGARYEAEFGTTFWTKGDEAQVEWPQGNRFTCKVRR